MEVSGLMIFADSLRKQSQYEEKKKKRKKENSIASAQWCSFWTLFQPQNLWWFHTSTAPVPAARPQGFHTRRLRRTEPSHWGNVRVPHPPLWEGGALAVRTPFTVPTFIFLKGRWRASRGLSRAHVNTGQKSKVEPDGLEGDLFCARQWRSTHKSSHRGHVTSPDQEKTHL